MVSRGGPIDLAGETEAVMLARALEALGHEVNGTNLNSGLHLILIDDQRLVGAADPRREGLVRGDEPGRLAALHFNVLKIQVAALRRHR